MFVGLISVAVAAIATFGTTNEQTTNATVAENEVTLRQVKHNAFGVGEKLTYRLHYGAIDAGEAIIKVESASKKIKDRELLHVVGEGKSISAFDWFFKVRDRYESYIDKDGVFPWLFIRRVDEGGFKINQDYTFYQHKKKVSDGQTLYNVPENIQDMISSFYYARTLDYSTAKVGDVFTINTFVDGEIFPLKIKYLGKETVKIRNGKYRCLKFAPVIQTGRVFKSEEDLNVWITDDGNKIPLLAKAKILVGSIKMELTKYENLANPIAKVD
ncbi:MAG: DUF3108 domain-containing protein [Bacteroidia bacterium]